MALVRKILESTIPSGGSSATFTDSDIPNSLIRVYSTNSNIYPQNISLTGNTLTVTYEVVSSALGVAVELVKQGLEIDDNLTSDNTDHALSAKQGKVLKGLIDDLDIPDNISELQDVDITDIEDGQVLAWDETAEKFVNVDQSGGGEIIYSLNEKIIGQWVDGSILYEKTILIPTVSTGTTYQHNITNVNKIWVQDIKATRNSTWFTSGHIFEDASNNIAESFSVIVSNLYLFTYLYGCTITDCYVTVRYTKTS